MEDRETPRMRKYGESKTTRIMMATVPHVTSVSGLRKISGRWIFVGQGVRVMKTDFAVLYFIVWHFVYKCSAQLCVSDCFVSSERRV